jgi:hypothetical protein
MQELKSRVGGVVNSRPKPAYAIGNAGLSMAVKIRA